MIDLMPLSGDQEPENASSGLHIDWLDDDWEVAPNVQLENCILRKWHECNVDAT